MQESEGKPISLREWIMKNYFKIVKEILDYGKWKDCNDPRDLNLGDITLDGERRMLGQDVTELPYLLAYLSNFDINSWLEVGVLDGASFYFWKEITEDNCLFVGIDKDRPKPLDIKNFHFIQGNLNRDYLSIIAEVANLSDSYDVVFIDNGHSYEDVKRDYKLFSKFSNKLMIFHDYYIWDGVRKFTNKLENIVVIPPAEIGKAGWAIFHNEDTSGIS